MVNDLLQNPSEFEEFYQLYLYAFNNPDTSQRRAYFFKRCEHALVYGKRTATGNLASGLLSLPFEVDFHGTRYQTKGICDVTTAPEASGQGHASNLLQTALEDMAKQGTTLSYLAPFSFKFYRRFGYEHVFDHCKYTLESSQVPQIKPKENSHHIKRGMLQDNLPTVADFYARLVKKGGLSGGLVRSEWWWHYLSIKNTWHCALDFNDRNQVAGYILYELQSDHLTVKEFLFDDPLAYQNLLTFIFAHQNTVGSFVFDTPTPTYHGDLLPEPRNAQCVIEPYMMARIVDLRDFLVRYPYQKRDFEPLRLTVTDKNLPANDGVWEIAASGERVTVQQVNATNVPDKLTIQQLTQIFFGTRSVRLLAATGAVTLRPETVNALEQLIVPEPPELVDYF
ncbi:GNAT family N-acetyltransferase [Ligilactobacillus pobuzihii]|uniref:Acetyltransferase n=1 Tax=Ligilactobacillus pobuzihii TaxID=449659 RepID=A0A0R2LS29_9LACO|nr:GNAT family N-acetyltransferase [Ligilactobacillus pobuzihii]KRK10282.1 acetyltransferase [Ligilactobacillus pobuzihii E100301 = KCTC 13174]KRO02045.1 acetyltransferase [Ligilactobacillus pobuzihii]GEN48199.1 GNAT family acetyltransferase [Ligilactobacillus pobuzihii]